MPGRHRQQIALDVDFCRAQFPAPCWDWAFFENAGGSFVPESVIARLSAYMRECQVQPGAPFASSTLAQNRMDQGHRLMAEMIGAAPDEVIIGPSTSANIDVLSRSLRPLWAEGDEIIVTSLNHEANSGPWRRLADTGMRIIEWPVNPETARPDLELLNRLLTDRTRMVAVPNVSNITGSIIDIKAISELAHAAGAMVCVDGVAFAPHRFVDVKAWDVDFYTFSLYKTFGPHIALMYGKKEHLLAARSQHHYFIGEDATSYKMNPAGPQHEIIASLVGVADYFEALSAKHFNDTPNHFTDRVRAVYELFAAHEENLAKIFTDWANGRGDVRIIGSPLYAASERVPTFSIVIDGKPSETICRAVEKDRIAIRNGDFYARRLVEAVGIENPDDGVIRCSMAHYTTPEEVKRLIAALDKAIAA